MTDWRARDVSVDLSFAGNDGCRAEIFSDGPNADRVGKDYKRTETCLLSAGKKCLIHLAPGGGFVMKLAK